MKEDTPTTTSKTSKNHHYGKSFTMDQSRVKRYRSDDVWPTPKGPKTDSLKGRYNLQDSYLASLCRDGVPCDIMLRNEASIRGKVIDYDNWSLLIHHEERSYLIFKSGIMALIPLKDVSYQPRPEPYPDRMFAEPASEYIH